ncbi:MAG: hypothetical protein ACFB20_12510 [Opitutales bacterium]
MRSVFSIALAFLAALAAAGCSTVENESPAAAVLRGETDRTDYIERVRETNAERTRQRSDPNAPDRPDFEPEFGDPGFNPEL